MSKSDFVWVLTDEEDGLYDIYKSKDSAFYGALEAIRESYNGHIPPEVLEDYCGSKEEDNFFIYLMEHPSRLHSFSLNVECRVVRD